MTHEACSEALQGAWRLGVGAPQSKQGVNQKEFLTRGIGDVLYWVYKKMPVQNVGICDTIRGKMIIAGEYKG